MDELDSIKKCNNVIGSARTIQTAVLVCEYLKVYCADPHSEIRKDQIEYRFKTATDANGYWYADILVVTWKPFTDPTCKRFIDVCRAFIAGRGEIWA